MDYSKMTDKELVWAFACETDPYEMLEIASHIRGKQTRERLMRRANVLRHAEDDCEG